MRFLANRNRNNACYVIEPQWIDRDARGQRIGVSRGLRAKFRYGVFDSDVAAMQFGWSEADKKKVEDYLLTHPHFMNQDPDNRIYLDEMTQTPEEIKAATVTPGVDLGLRCLKFFIASNNESQQCPHEVVAGKEFCAEHLKEVERVSA